MEPSPALVQFAKIVSVRRTAEAHVVAAIQHHFLDAAEHLLTSSVQAGDCPEVIIDAADQVAAACVGALMAAHGWVPPATVTQLLTEQALDVLQEELCLSPASMMPLHSVRVRAAEIRRGLPEDVSRPDDRSDRYLAHASGRLLSELLSETQFRTSQSMH